MYRNFAVVAGLAVCSFAVPAAAQEAQPGHASTTAESSPAPQAGVPSAEEVARIRERLRDLQERARQDPAVTAANDAFGEEVMAAMLRLDPTAAPKKARADAIQAEAEQARAASDNERLNALAEEGRTLQAFFTALRSRAMALPEIEQSRQAYIAKLFEKMTELDPQAPDLVSRLDAARAAQQRQSSPAPESPAP